MNIFAAPGPAQTGMGLLQGELLRRLKTELPHHIDRQTEVWDAYDKALYLDLGQPFIPARIEKPRNYYPGSRPGVLGMPWDTFPAILAMSDSATPTVESSSFDSSTHVFAPSVFIEGVIRSDEFKQDDARERLVQEDVVDRRAKRTIEAIVAAIDAEPTLGGILHAGGIGAPTCGQTDPFNIDSPEAGKHHRSRVFVIIRVQYGPDFYSARLDASQPLPGVLPMDILAR